jgi:hypothetical protein
MLNTMGVRGARPLAAVEAVRCMCVLLLLLLLKGWL